MGRDIKLDNDDAVRGVDSGRKSAQCKLEKTSSPGDRLKSISTSFCPSALFE